MKRNPHSHRPGIRSAFVGLALMLGTLLCTAPAPAQDLLPNPYMQYDMQCYLSSHNSYCNPDQNFMGAICNQDESIGWQLTHGVRCLDLDLWLVKQKKIALTYHILVYNTHNGKWEAPTYDPAEGSALYNVKSADAEIVTAHEAITYGYKLLNGIGTGHKYRNLLDELTTIRKFLDANPKQLVTLKLESYLPDASLLRSYLDEAGLTRHIFWADAPNVGCWVDRNDCKPGNYVSWDVKKHGWPLISEMLGWGKNLVIFTDSSKDGMPLASDHIVSTSWKHALDPKLCTDVDPPLYDIRHELFEMTYHPEQVFSLAGYTNLGGTNDSSRMLNFWAQNLVNNVKCGRIPNFLTVDYAAKGAHGGPASMVTYMNYYWSQSLVPHSQFNTQIAANEFGWYNKDIPCSINGIADLAGNRTAIAEMYSAEPVPGNTGQTIAPTTQYFNFWPNGQTVPIPFTIHTEGATCVFYRALSSLGPKSPLHAVTLKLDKTPPHTERAFLQSPLGRAIKLTATDTVSGAYRTYCRVDGRNWALYYQPWVMPVGAHTIQYYSVDYAGNPEPVQTLYTN